MFDVAVANLDRLECEALARGALDAAAPVAVDQRVARDRQQPRRSRAVDLRRTGREREERRGERLGRQVHRHLRISGALEQERQHQLVATLVEHPERLALAGRGARDQLPVAPRIHRRSH